jgi:hypothetical protein
MSERELREKYRRKQEKWSQILRQVEEKLEHSSYCDSITTIRLFPEYIY